MFASSLPDNREERVLRHDRFHHRHQRFRRCAFRLRSCFDGLRGIGGVTLLQRRGGIRIDALAGLDGVREREADDD